MVRAIFRLGSGSIWGGVGPGGVGGTAGGEAPMTADPPGPSKKDFDARLRAAQARRAERKSETGTTRFLVITHHRMTMARVDRLFGVTMGERGVSQLVSVDLGAAGGLRESA